MQYENVCYIFSLHGQNLYEYPNLGTYVQEMIVFMIVMLKWPYACTLQLLPRQCWTAACGPMPCGSRIPQRSVLNSIMSFWMTTVMSLWSSGGRQRFLLSAQWMQRTKIKGDQCSQPRTTPWLWWWAGLNFVVFLRYHMFAPSAQQVSYLALSCLHSCPVDRYCRCLSIHLVITNCQWRGVSGIKSWGLHLEEIYPQK